MLLITSLVAGLYATLCFSQEERLEEYGSVPIALGTPYSSIYIGLKESEHDESPVMEVIREFARTNAIRECPAFPMGYSGPPLAAYVGDKTAIFIAMNSTSLIATKRINFGRSFDWYHWPTSGSMETNGGRAIQMPFTTIVGVSPFGTNYSLDRLKSISEGLVSSLQRAFTNRNVHLFMSETNRP